MPRQLRAVAVAIFAAFVGAWACGGARADEPAPASGPASPPEVRAGDATVFRIGVLLQPQAAWTALPEGGTSQSLLLRRARVTLGGELTRRFAFVVAVEAQRIGAVDASGSKAASPDVRILDAVAAWRVARGLELWAGRTYVPTSREVLKSSTSLLPLDGADLPQVPTLALGGTSGRDVGFQLRGLLLGDRLEVRTGVFQGARDDASRRPFRAVARLQANLLDTEAQAFPAYPGSYRGTARVLAVGLSFDAQLAYRGVTADVFADVPVAFGSVLGTATWQHLDGGTSFPALPRQDLFSVEAGLFHARTKLGGWARWERRAPEGAPGQELVAAGLSWFFRGNALNLKAGWGRTVPEGAPGSDRLTLQLQLFAN